MIPLDRPFLRKIDELSIENDIHVHYNAASEGETAPWDFRSAEE